MRTIAFRLRFFCMVMFLTMAFVGSGYAQQTNTDTWKNETITLRVSNTPLGKVLEKVAEAAKAKISLQGVTLVNIKNATTLNVKEKPLYEVINDLIGDQKVKVRYEVNRQIIIEPLEGPKEDSNKFFISGVVLDKETGEPLIGATVMVTDGGATSDRGCITDIDGKFSLSVARKESIRVTYIG